MSTEKRQPEEDIAWHPAFFQAIRRELAQYADVLEFISEYQLTAEPLRIDIVIIKKLADIVLTKNIAAIFRAYNLIEYKSPTDYLSVADFYKVYGYVCLYIFLNTKVGISDVTLTFVESHYPRKLLAHLKKVRGYKIEKKGEGIYHVIGDIIPIQIIDSRKLSEAENIWLKSLDNTLDVGRMNRITQEIDQLGKAAQLGAYLDVIARANAETIKEAIKMSKSKVTLEQVLIETGLAAKWEAQGEVRGEARGEAKAKDEVAKAKAEVVRLKEGVARNLIQIGLSLEKIAQVSELEIETVKSLV